MAAKNGFKKQPSAWPPLSFILIKIFQAISSMTILAVMAFFGYHLKNDKYSIPWQFVALSAISVISLMYTFTSFIFFCCRALDPVYIMVVEFLISVLWAFGAGAIGKGMGVNTIRACRVWKTSEGVTVCHLFKLVFSFTIICWFAMICGVLLAAGVRRRQTSHKYQPANPTSLQKQSTAYAPQTGMVKTNVPYGQGGTYKGNEDHAPTYS